MLKISVGLISELLFSTSLYSCASTVKQEVSKEIEVQKVEVKAPVARVIPSSKIYGTDNYLDNYAWLRNKNDPAVISYLVSKDLFPIRPGRSFPRKAHPKRPKSTKMKQQKPAVTDAPPPDLPHSG